MRGRLSGERIALFESRMADELSELVRRSGGIPVCAPALVENPRPATREVAALLDLVGELDEAPVFVFSTGVGARALFDEARTLGRSEELLHWIQRGGAVCRGPKAVAALFKEGLVASLRARSPFTTTELLEALGTVRVGGMTLVVVHYGERNEALVQALTDRGAVVLELLVYGWEMPEDLGPLVRMIDGLIRGDFAAAAFTTQIQARHLLEVSIRMGRLDGLVDALASRVVVAAVGPTCARVMEELGIPAHVVPESPKMGPMLEALVARLGLRSAA